MNDIRIDNRQHAAYLTDSGEGGLVIVDLNSGKAHRVLDGHPSVMPEQDVQIIVNGKPVLMNGKPPQFKSDSLALSPDGQYVYYKAITANTVYRIKTDVLRNANASASDVANAVEKAGTAFPTDGFWMDAKGNLYLSDINHNAVVRRTPDEKMEKLTSDPRLQWPDTFSEGPDGSIYITASHINDSPRFNQGKSTRKQPYMVFKFKP
jgi:sugar lactone lactonase YvrE